MCTLTLLISLQNYFFLGIVKGMVHWRDQEMMGRELFCQYKQHLYLLLKHLKQILFYMTDWCSLELGAAKFGMGASHPMFIYFSLGINGSKPNPKPKIKVKYLKADYRYFILPSKSRFICFENKFMRTMW